MTFIAEILILTSYIIYFASNVFHSIKFVTEPFYRQSIFLNVMHSEFTSFRECRDYLSSLYSSLKRKLKDLLNSVRGQGE